MVTQNPGKRMLEIFQAQKASPESIAERWAYRHNVYRSARYDLVVIGVLTPIGIMLLLWGAWSLLFSSDDSNRFLPALVLLVVAVIGLLVARRAITYEIGRLYVSKADVHQESNEYYRRIQSAEGIRLIDHVVPSFRNQRPMGYVVFQGGRIDIWPGAHEHKPNRFIVRKRQLGGFAPAYCSPVFSSLREAVHCVLGE